MSSLGPRRMFVDSLPIAAVMLFWLVVSWLGSHPLIGEGARIAGLVMALMYAIVRGIKSATHTHSAPALTDVESVLRVNGFALLAGAGWFIVARLVVFTEQLWGELALQGVFTSPAEGLTFAFTATGVLTIVMYAVTLGTAVLREESPPGQGNTIPGGSPADD